MFHEATACHVTSDVVDLLGMLYQCLRVARESMDRRGQCWFADMNRLSLGVWPWRSWIEGVSVGLLM